MLNLILGNVNFLISSFTFLLHEEKSKIEFILFLTFGQKVALGLHFRFKSLEAMTGGCLGSTPLFHTPYRLLGF